jgi:hypothetical protein
MLDPLQHHPFAISRTNVTVPVKISLKLPKVCTRILVYYTGECSMNLIGQIGRNFLFIPTSYLIFLSFHLKDESQSISHHSFKTVTVLLDSNIHLRMSTLKTSGSSISLSYRIITGGSLLICDWFSHSFAMSHHNLCHLLSSQLIC